MPNMCTCSHHYASHEGYNALKGEGGGPCMGEGRRCGCKAFVHAVEPAPEPTPISVFEVAPRQRRKRGGAA